jgi:cytochrome b561
MQTQNYSRIYRILHWAIALSMLFLLLTVFLRLTWMNKHNVAAIIQDFMKSTDQILTEDEAISLAKKIRKPMWMWHIYIGYVLVGLFTIRFSLPFFGEMKFQSPFKKSTLSEKFKSWVYIVFYICVTISLTTGMFIEFGPDSLHEIMEEIHVLSIYYLLSFIVIHLSGVLIAEFSNEKGIISRIVSGKNKD